MRAPRTASSCAPCTPAARRRNPAALRRWPDAARAVAFEISRLLDTGLDRETLSICVSLLESGVHPDALAAVVKELRREAAELKARPHGAFMPALAPLLTDARAQAAEAAAAQAGHLPVAGGAALAGQASEGEPSVGAL